jgi:hypothetical protein
MTAEKANLGLASTEEMMRELICRFRVNVVCSAHPVDVDRALVLAEMLGGMDVDVREYRTVDG